MRIGKWRDAYEIKIGRLIRCDSYKSDHYFLCDKAKKILIHSASHEKNVWRQRMNKADYERNENEDIRSYLTRAARIYASIVDDGLLKEENVFQVECSETELQEFKNYVFEIILPIVRKVVECESKRLMLSKSIQEILFSRVCELMVNDFGEFNMAYEETGEIFSLECFIKSRIKGCIRASIAEEQGITVNRSRQLYTITKIRSAIAFDNQMEEDDVSVEMIYQRLEQEAVKQKKRPISKKLLIELLNYLNGVEYISELEEQGIQIAGKVEKQPFVLEEETKQILDEVFLNMSGLEIYILLKEYGFLGEEIRKQEMDQFVKTETFLRLMDEDKGIRAEQNLIKMAYNKNSKIKKILKSMNGKVNMLDLEGVIEDYLYRKKQEYHIL